VPLNFGQPWLLVDGTEPITYYRRTTGDNYDDGTSVANAKRRVTQQTIAQTMGQMTSQQLVWHIWAGQLGGAAPKIGDVIEDGAGVTWNVVDRNVETQGTRFRLTTVREVGT
jgi:hypothetical protein